MATDPTESFARPWVAAGVLFYDHGGQVMMVVPTYKDYLDLPGGYVEHGESPLRGAMREVREELGITPPIGRLLVVDWLSDPERDNQRFVFDGGTLEQEWSDRIVLEEAELAGYEFHDLASIETVTIPRLARRITQADHARREGTTLYLENGEAVSGSLTTR